MSVLGKVLGGAFVGGLADRMRENREYTKTQIDKSQAYLYTAGIKRQNEVAKARQELTEATDYLESKGMNTKKLTALLDQNPRELLKLYGAAIKSETRMTINGQILDSAVDISGYGGSESSASDLIINATPDFVEGADLKKPDEVERNMLQEMFKTPDLKEIMYDAYSSDILGVKGKDIQASLSAPTIKARKGEGVTTDMSVFGVLDQNDILQGQAIIRREYDSLLDQKILELKTQAADAEENNTGNVTEIQMRATELKKIKDMTSPSQRKEKLELLLKNPDIGFDIAKQYYLGANGSSYFINQPAFIDNSLLTYISGEEDDYPFPSPSSGPGSETPQDPPSVTYPDIEIQEGQDPLKQAKLFFGKRGNGEEMIVDIILPDGTKKTYIRKDRSIIEKPQGS